MTKAKVMRWGNSLAVRIPRGVADEARMKEGDAVQIKAIRGRIELRRAERMPCLAELVAEITPENRYEETDWGTGRGREKVEW